MQVRGHHADRNQGFGTLGIGDDAAFDVSSSNPDFSELRHVALLGAGAVSGRLDEIPEQDEHATYRSQDVDDGDLAVLCIVAWVAFPDYDIEHDIRVLSLVTTQRENGEELTTANLRGPSMVGTHTRRLQQVIWSDSRWPICGPFDRRLPAEANGESASDARGS